MAGRSDINWHNGWKAGLEYEYEGVCYRQGRNQCVFSIGDLVLPASPILIGMPKRIAGIIFDMKQDNPNNWPEILVNWSDGTEKWVKSKDLWRIISDGTEEKDR